MQSLERLLGMLAGVETESERKDNSKKPQNMRPTFDSILLNDPELSQVFGGLKAENPLASSLHEHLSARLLQLVEVALLANRAPSK